MASRVAGVSIVGFRDIREPLYIGPWGKVNLLGGTNNSGKSAVLDGIRLALDGETPRRSDDPLDVPQVLTDGMVTPFEVGYLLDLSKGKSIGSAYAETITGQESLAIDGLSEVTQLLGHPGFSGPAPLESSRWFWISPDNVEQVPPRQEEAYPERFDGMGSANRIRELGYAGTLSWGAFAWRAFQNASRPEKVVHIPAARRIVPTDHRGRSLPNTSGEGLPGMLLSMLAPSAEEFHSAKRRLAQINEFLREVLNRESAELLVPHDAQTIHVALEERVLPLSHLGAGLEQLVLLAAVCTEYENCLVLMEEPDLYLHPTYQRQLMHHLYKRTSNTYIATTHSAAMLDIDFSNVWSIDWSAEQGTTATLITTGDGRAGLAQRLGFRASDLVQSNAIIWVEGPSDRLYLRRFLELEDSTLIEGVHYSFVIYGGALGEHLSAAPHDSPGRIGTEQFDDFIRVTRINRNSVFVMDSDLTKPDQPLSQFKSRIIKEFSETSPGLAWVTGGYTIENYLSKDDFHRAYSAIHPRKPSPYSGDMNQNPFVGGVKQPNKVAIAKEVCGDLNEIPDRGDLKQRIKKLASFLRDVNRGPVLVSKPVD